MSVTNSTEVSGMLLTYSTVGYNMTPRFSNSSNQQQPQQETAELSFRH